MSNYFKQQEDRFYQLLKEPKPENDDCPIFNLSRPDGFTHEQYQNKLFQKAYFLKYGRAYIYDYKNIFSKLIDNLIDIKSDLLDKESLTVLSIGCGVGLDFPAARWAFEEKGYDITLNYTGIDSVNWYDQMEIELESQYIQQHIDDINDEIIQDADVIVFSRSITDIPHASLISFAKRLAGLNQECYILFAHVHSSRSSNTQRKEGCNRINSMIKVFIENKLNVKIIEKGGPPNVKEVIDFTKFSDIKKRCLSTCPKEKCEFIPIKNINNYGYHHILRVTPND